MFSLLLLLSSISLADDHDVCGLPGDTNFLAAMPVSSYSFPPTGPTYPEGIAVVGSRVITSGPANFGTAGNNSPSQLTVFSRQTGALQAQIPVIGEDLSQEHALSELYADGNRLYAPSTQLGLLSWKLQGSSVAEQKQLSTPFYSTTAGCPAGIRAGLPPLPNGVTVAADGTAYVTDALQGLVWRVREGAAPVAPEVLFCDPALQGSGSEGLSMFGANGIAVSGDDLYVAVSFGPFDNMGPSSVIYKLSRSEPDGLTAVASFQGVEVAPGLVIPPIVDGLRMAPNGHLFAVLAGQGRVVEMDVSGDYAVELASYAGNDPMVPFVNPSTIDFSPSGDVAYLTNHAITQCLPGDPNPGCLGYGAAGLFGVFELCVDGE